MRVNTKPVYRPTTFVSRLILTGLVLGMLAGLTGCALVHHYDAITGKVVDLDTGEPLEGAAVHASYYTTFYNMIDPTSWYLNSQETLTDAKGEFIIPAQFSFAFRPMNLFSADMNLIIYKPGFKCFPGYSTIPTSGVIRPNQNINVLVPKSSTLDDRMKNVHCDPSPSVPENDYTVLFRLINEERVYLGLEPMTRSK